MRKRMRFVGLWLLIGGGIIALWALQRTPAAASAEPATEPVFVEIVEPVATAAPKEKPEECTGGCSLAKHDIPEFKVADFEKALATYATSAPDEANEGLDSLLFYNTKTTTYLEGFGSGPLSADHIRFLRRELARTRATVWLRLIDQAGKERVATGPMTVPLGQKQHLHPTINGVQPLEFNGTILRTGLYHLWSRY